MKVNIKASLFYSFYTFN